MSITVNIIQDPEPVTVNIDNQENIKVNISAPVPEAPVDGLQYARKDASWVEVAAAGLTAASFGAFMHGLTIKPTPVDIDDLVIKDSEDSNNAKGLSWANLKATLKNYFDNIYAAVIGDNSITNAKLAQIATNIIKGRSTAGTGNVEDLTATQVTAILNQFSDALKGLVPASGGGTTNYLRADGNWAAPPGGISDTAQAWSATIQFDGNYGSFNTNAHTQSGTIAFTINWTGAVFGAEVVRTIQSNGDTITLPSGDYNVISDNAATGTLIGLEFTPVNGNQYYFIFKCVDVSNEKYDCFIVDAPAGYETTKLNTPTLSSATLDSGLDIDLVYTDPNTSPQEVNVEIQVDTVDTFDSGSEFSEFAAQDSTGYKVTCPDYSTLYYFRVRAKGDGITTSDSDWSGTQSATTGSGSSIILMEDDFAGTTIDTGKWTETDPDGVITQNNQLIFTGDGSSLANRTNYLQSIQSNSGESVVAVQFTVTDAYSGDPSWWFGLWNDNSGNNEITILDNGGNASLNIREGGGSEYSFNSSVSLNGNTFKILKNGNDISFYYLSAPDTWTQIGTTRTVVFSSTLYAVCAARDFTGTLNSVYIDDFYFTNADYATSVPT
jgi:hypothetical protein